MTRFVVCTGSTLPDVMADAMTSLRNPFVLTMDHVWFEVAAEKRIPRMFFNDKLNLMQFVLGKEAICLYANSDDEAGSMAASMTAMDVPVWRIQTIN